jgi:hypothetical protein
MTEASPPDPRRRRSLRNSMTNWNQPLPLGTKLRLLARNYVRRITTHTACCGNDGEPGC